ncbi:MAG: NAD-binding protein [Candidatus Methanoperedens sp.]|nr:NAD-binding protein [Candidatus Methanoperedens sp.]
MFKLKINKSIFAYVSIFTFFVLIYSILFQHLMYTYENKDFSFVTSVYWVIVSMTTVGYGDIYFTTPIGQLFSALVALSGVMMIFALLFPLVVTPWLERRTLKELPTRAPLDLKEHIIICGYNQLVETLISELDDEKIPFLIVDDDEKSLRKLKSRKILCVFGDATDKNTLLDSNIHSARMLIANKSDEMNASIVLTAREISSIEIISIVENTAKSKYLRYAGSDRVISPKTLFGTYLGRKAVDPLTDHLAGATGIFENISIVELPIYPRSVLIGKKLVEANIRRRTGANIVGLWTGGTLSLNPHPSDSIKENSVLLAVGTENQLEALKELTRGVL